jgi:hypothetical protein
MFRPGGLRLSAQPIGATVNASPASTRVTTHDWGHCGSLLFDVRLFHPLPCAVSQRPENVRTQFLSLLQVSRRNQGVRMQVGLSVRPFVFPGTLRGHERREFEEVTSGRLQKTDLAADQRVRIVQIRQPPQPPK